MSFEYTFLSGHFLFDKCTWYGLSPAIVSVDLYQSLYSSVTSHITGYTHHITTPITCTSENVIYLWRCTKCKINFSINKRNETPVCPKAKADEIGSLYAGKKKQFFKTRLGEHLGYIGGTLRNQRDCTSVYLATTNITSRAWALNKLGAKIPL